MKLKRITASLIVLVGVLTNIQSNQTAQAVGVTAAPSVAAGGLHSVVLKSNGTVWTFGNNGFGQLGFAPRSAANETPRQVPTPMDVTAIAAGFHHTAVLKSDGTVWTFGYGYEGQLGYPTSPEITGGYFNPNPRLVPGLSGVVAITAGAGHTVALKADGTVWIMGNSYELGAAPNPTARVVAGLNGITAIAAGRAHTVARKSDGTVWTFGQSEIGQLGYMVSAPPLGFSAIPQAVPGLNNVTFIASGPSADHTIAIKADGSVWTFGDNRYGQLGFTANGTPNPTPTPLPGLSATAAAAGDHHTVALKSNGTVEAFGDNQYGQLGSSTSRAFLDVVTVVAGLSDTIVLKQDGTVWTFGLNDFGKLGRATATLYPNPAPGFVDINLREFPSSSPFRIMDTRPGGTTVDGSYAGIGIRPAGSITEMVIGGRAGTASNTQAVALNVTVTGATAAGYVTVFPCGSPQPNASNLNFRAGQTIANLVFAKVGINQKICIYTSAPTQLIVDLSTAYTTPTQFAALVPARLTDTRIGAATIDTMSDVIGLRAPNSITEIQVANRGGASGAPASVALNVTAVNPLTAGYITVFPCDSPQPNASNINYTAGDVIPNAVIVKVSNTGKVCVYTSAATNLIVDLTGELPASGLTPTAPLRLVDTRSPNTTFDNQYAGEGLRAPGSIYEIDIRGRNGIANTATSVALNITVTAPNAPGYITVYPCGTTQPGSSNLNYTTGQTIANAVISQLGTNGKICIFNTTTTHLIIDTNGTTGP
jgi:alpha-tubulin suppressor-like RCC1 family protein